MDILIIDIGCTWTKSVVLRAGKVFEKFVARTPVSANDLMAVVWELVNKVFAAGYALQGVLPISFSESVIVETRDGDLRLFGPYIPEDVVFPETHRPSYWLTGYPRDPFPGVVSQLAYIDALGLDIKRVLPVSSMVAALLCGESSWAAWDSMHASNSGLYGDGAWLSDARDYSFMSGESALPPSTVVGEFPNGTPVFLGGHDSLFAGYPQTPAYVSCGTYMTVSEPSKFSEVHKEVDEVSVRYVEDATGRYHRQKCWLSSGRIRAGDAQKIREFLCVDDVLVFGRYTAEMVSVLKNYGFSPRACVDAQWMGAAAVAEKGVYDRQSVGAIAS